MALIRIVETALSFIDRLVMWFIGVMLLVMTIVLFANSIGRAVLNLSFVGGPALGRLLMIWLTFMGAYRLVRTSRHITIDIAMRAASDRYRRLLVIVINLAGAVTTGYLTWLGYLFTLSRFERGQMDPMLSVPTGIFYLAIPLGCALMATSFLHNALKAVVEDRPEGVLQSDRLGRG
ncbi:MAG: TRAP transporter small permease [Alphaproteobacteria bacterium]|nr:TRAP transporter small permease [Alphaproteobacteria bacterium]